MIKESNEVTTSAHIFGLPRGNSGPLDGRQFSEPIRVEYSPSGTHLVFGRLENISNAIHKVDSHT